MPTSSKPQIAVVSPFLDKRHGTERCVSEQIERLARDYEVHVYSNRVEDVDLSRIIWHRVRELPGPHLLAYCWWVIANRLSRWLDRRLHGLAPALVYSPGINCFDADVVSVHIVFAELHRRTRHALAFRINGLRSWPRILHRRIYYRLLIAFERLVYGRERTLLIAVSGAVAHDLKRYGRAESQVPVIVHGIDAQRFSVETRRAMRYNSRHGLGLKDHDFCLLLVGNDWKTKGLPCLLEAVGRLSAHRLRLLVVGHDMVDPYRPTVKRLKLENRVTFLPPRPDVEFYYAAADLYVGPSLADAFALPPLEAMACGVPAIVSRQAGVSNTIRERINGLILEDPQDADKLADLIALLYQNEGLRQQIGEAAASTAQQYTWDRNAEKLGTIFEQIVRSRGRHPKIEFQEAQ
jgi:glycosyltransferase involved in cell wall biosynthesis